MSNTISSVNSIFVLVIPGVFSVPQTLRQYDTDMAFEAEEVEVAQVEKGVDNNMVSGFSPFITPVRIKLQASSPSNDVFDTWLETMKSAGDTFPASGQISLPSIGKKYALTNGVLTRMPAFSGARKVLAARTFTISWDDISAANA